jgi:hypothetical protein
VKPGHKTAALVLLVFCATNPAAAAGKKTPPPTLRWAEGQPGSTFSHDDDGKNRYGLWKDDVGLIMAVDGHELRNTRERPQHLLAIQCTIRYRGNRSMEFSAEHITLEFVSHRQVVHPALDPDDLVTSLQNDSDTLSDEFEREARKHPDQKEEKEARLQAYQRDVTELQEFLTTHSLRPGTLDTGNSELSGWVFLSTTDKWIGGWKKQEQFLLRIPLAGRVFEFPFKLGSSESDLTLRKRP